MKLFSIIFAAALALATAAQAQDPAAVTLMTDGARQVAAARGDLGWRPGLRLCLSGGLGPQFAPFLPAEMQADMVVPQAAPLEGAIALAQDQADALRQGHAK